MIQLDRISKTYGNDIIVNDLSLEVKKGEVCVIIGPSGCGKSTTLKMINQMVKPTNGEIIINGRPSGSFKPEMLRRQMGYVIQNIGLFPHLTVAENIAIVPKMLAWSRSRITDRVAELLILIGLSVDGYRNKYPRELSGGEAQRVGVARALAADPPVLLMDEPFGAVDPLNRVRLQTEFLRIQKELRKTVIFITHDLDEAIRIADKIVIMHQGTILQYDTPENILAKPKTKFIMEFVGLDRELKLLSRFMIADYMRQPQTVELNEIIAAEAGLRKEFTLKEALSRMVGNGIQTVPVIDDDSKIIGEISPADIGKVMGNGVAR
jgi:osmoprotectant transport system ATP-binding protein